MEAIQANEGALLWVVFWVLVAGLVLWFIALAILKSIQASRRKGTKHAESEEVAHPVLSAVSHHTETHHHVSGDSHGDDHHDGHHNHPKGPLWRTALVWSMAILAFVVLLWACSLILSSWGFGQKPGLTRDGRANVLAGRHQSPPASEVPLPDGLITCTGETIVIPQGESIVVFVEPGMIFSSKPDTKDGTITQCDYYNPGICTSSFARLQHATTALTVTNVSSGTKVGPVDYVCSYRPR